MCLAARSQLRRARSPVPNATARLRHRHDRRWRALACPRPTAWPAACALAFLAWQRRESTPTHAQRGGDGSATAHSPALGTVVWPSRSHVRHGNGGGAIALSPARGAAAWPLPARSTTRTRHEDGEQHGVELIGAWPRWCQLPSSVRRLPRHKEQTAAGRYSLTGAKLCWALDTVAVHRRAVDVAVQRAVTVSAAYCYLSLAATCTRASCRYNSSTRVNNSCTPAS